MAAMADAGLHPDVLRQHFENQYAGRRSVMDFLRERAGLPPAPPEGAPRPAHEGPAVVGPDGALSLRRRFEPPVNPQQELDVVRGRSLSTGDLVQNQGQPIIQDILNRRAPGWELVQSPSQSAGDRIGVDFILRNRTTGEWLPLDVTTRAKPGRMFTIELLEAPGPNRGFDPETRTITPEGRRRIEQFLFGDSATGFAFVERNQALAQQLAQLDHGRTPPLRDLLLGNDTAMNPTLRQQRIQEFIDASAGNAALAPLREHAQRAMGHATHETTFDTSLRRSVDDYVLNRRRTDVDALRNNIEVDINGRILGWSEGNSFNGGRLLEHTAGTIERMRLRTDLTPEQTRRLTQLETLHTQASTQEQRVRDLAAGLDAHRRGVAADANAAIGLDAANPAALQARAREALTTIRQPRYLVEQLQAIERSGRIANDQQRQAYLEARLAVERQNLRTRYNELLPMVRDHLVWGEYSNQTTRAAAFADRGQLQPSVESWARHQAQWDGAFSMLTNGRRDFLPHSWTDTFGTHRPLASTVEIVAHARETGVSITHDGTTYRPSDISHYDTANRQFVTTDNRRIPLAEAEIRIRVQEDRALRNAQGLQAVGQMDNILRREARVDAEFNRLRTEMPEITPNREQIRDRLRTLDGNINTNVLRFNTPDGSHMPTVQDLVRQWDQFNPATRTFLQDRILEMTDTQRGNLRRALEELRTRDGMTIPTGLSDAANM